MVASLLIAALALAILIRRGKILPVLIVDAWAIFEFFGLIAKALSGVHVGSIIIAIIFIFPTLNSFKGWRWLTENANK